MIEKLVCPTHILPIKDPFAGSISCLGQGVITITDKKNLEKADLFVLGLPDDTEQDGKTFYTSADALREQLYSLAPFTGQLQIVDLGNLRGGNSPEQIKGAFQLLFEELRSFRCSVMIFGKNHDYTQHIAAGMGDLLQELTLIDDRLDINNCCEQHPFLNHISTKIAVNLLAGQAYFINERSLEKHYLHRRGEVLQLGELREDIRECEPFLRVADFTSFDFASLKSSEAPGQRLGSPNGLYGEEACQLTWYAGLKPGPQVFALLGYEKELDPSGQGAMLGAQICWYYLKGIEQCKDEIPDEEANGFMHHLVPIDGLDEPILFLRNEQSDRWWMAVNVSGVSENDPTHWLPCSEGDYLAACRNEIPQRWWNFVRNQ